MILEEVEEIYFRCVDLDPAMAGQEAEYIEVREEIRSREIAESMKEYFSNFSLERKESLTIKEPKGNKGTRRVKICCVM